MTRIIAVASGKGGVGKTTLVANLATALALYGKSVVAIDANLSTSNLGLHLGIHLYPKTLHDVLEGKAKIHEATYKHKTGFRVVPADISLRKIKKVGHNDFVDIFYKLMKGTDFILIDSAAGLGKEAQASIEAADELVTVTNPELPAVTDAMKLGLLANKFETHNLGVVVNRIKGEKHELPLDHIEEMLGVPVLGTIPEDKEVRKSIALKEPLVYCNPKAIAAQHMRALAANLIGEYYKPKIPWSIRLFGWLGK